MIAWCALAWSVCFGLALLRSARYARRMPFIVPALRFWVRSYLEWKSNGHYPEARQAERQIRGLRRHIEIARPWVRMTSKSRAKKNGRRP